MSPFPLGRQVGRDFLACLDVEFIPFDLVSDSVSEVVEVLRVRFLGFVSVSAFLFLSSLSSSVSFRLFPSQSI